VSGTNIDRLTPAHRTEVERGRHVYKWGRQKESKNSKNGKNPLTHQNRRNALVVGWGVARGPRGGPLCKVLETGRKEIFRNLQSKKKFWGGADPQTVGGNPSEIGGICSPGGGLKYRIETDGNGSKTMEISRVKKYTLAPPSGQTERRSREMGPKCSSRPRGL